MYFNDAVKFKIKWMGHKYEGKTIDEVGATDEGLVWLDGKLRHLAPFCQAYQAIHTYLSDPLVQKDLQEILVSNRDRAIENILKGKNNVNGN